ncbi:MAG: glycosyltransferase [Solirubrobacteraceae bacterium]
MSTAAVVIPVRDGARYLAEVLEAVARERPDEVLVIDSGSADGSVQIARDAGAEVLEIAPEAFGHGRTRNLGAEHTSGDLIVFLTQDATPVPGWLAAHREAHALADRVGASYGPHLPRPDTSPMIARELTEFFAAHSPDGRPVVQRAGDRAFLSNVNAAYARACWAEVRFPDVGYAEDQAFAAEMLARGWAKVFHPGAAVLHAHDYPPAEFMRRYFDEYRGLRETIGHVETIGVRSTARHVRGEVRRDRAWLRERGAPRGTVARWTGRSAVHHSGRQVFSALGSRADRLPAAVQRALSLEGRASAPGGAPPAGPPPTATVSPRRREPVYADWRRFLDTGPAPLLEPVPGMEAKARLHVAVVIPPFRRGSGGHNSILHLVRGLEAMGHTCTIWLHDPTGLHDGELEGYIRGNLVDFFGPFAAPVFKGLDRWYGADVAVATGWQTVFPVMGLDGCRARAYLVHDHEPEFYGTSVERTLAEATYSLGLHCIAASPWLAGIVRDRYGASASDFTFGVDHEVYWPRPVAREPETIAFYGRAVTERRAVMLGMLALDELARRRPGARIVIFGDPDPLAASFRFEHAGVAAPEQLAWLYSQATVGLCLSLTNYSLIPNEMLACGLPCVDLAGMSTESVFGADGPVELAEPAPGAIADAIERLLADRAHWAARSEAGLRYVASHSWPDAAARVEAGLREALRLRAADA